MVFMFVFAFMGTQVLALELAEIKSCKRIVFESLEIASKEIPHLALKFSDHPPDLKHEVCGLPESRT